MKTFFQVLTPLCYGEVLFRGYTSDPNFKLGEKSRLEVVTEKEIRAYQTYNHGQRHDLSTGEQLLETLISEPIYDYSKGYLQIIQGKPIQ